MRVISLLPSATDILGAIGATDVLVGRSHECDWPPEVTSTPALTAQRTTGGTSAEIDAQVRESLASGNSLYTLDAERLRSLRPDVILTQDLCEVCSIDLGAVRSIASTLSPRPEIVSLNPTSIEDVLDDVLRVGEAIGRAAAARDAVVRLRDRYWTASDYVTPYVTGPEIAFLEWLDPIFVGGHWTPQLIENAGGRHSLNPPRAKSRQVQPDELVASQPQRVIVCPCGLDLERTRVELAAVTNSSWWRALPAVADGNVAIVDGNQMFNRPGPRLVDAYCWLVAWIQERPEVMPVGFPWSGGLGTGD